MEPPIDNFVKLSVQLLEIFVLPTLSIVKSLLIYKVPAESIRNLLFKFIVPSDENVYLLLHKFTLLVLVSDPIVILVASPPIFKVVATVLNKFCVKLDPITVGLLIVNEPVV